MKKTLDSDATLKETLDRLKSLHHDSKAQWGKMNAHQMVCHLNDAFSFAMGHRQASDAVTFASRTIVRWVALHSNLKWPKGVPTRPEVDQLHGGTPPTDFLRDSSALAASIQQFAAKPRSYAFSGHPIFGELTEWEWMRWGYLHVDHHLRQFGR